MRADPSNTDVRPEIGDAVRDVERQLGGLFARARVGWREAAASVHPDLQPLGYQMLALLVNGQVDSASAIVDHLRIDKSVVSRQVRQLESLELVVSTPDPADGRARLLRATPRAVERVERARSAYSARLLGALSTSTSDELHQFAEMLRRLTV